MIESLNEEFGIAEHVVFAAGNGGLPKVILHGEHADVEVYLHGGTITSYRLRSGREVLWLSKQSHFANDRPIRGGVPICWPWFGQPDPQMPQHGFARTSQWTVVRTEVADGDGNSNGDGDGNSNRNSRVKLSLQLNDSPQTRDWWPHQFQLTLHVSLGTTLEFGLTCLNTDVQPFTVETALHSYFNIADVSDLRIEGLADCDYLDKLDKMAVKRDSGSLTIDKEIDRIYVPTTGKVTLFEAERPRVEVSKTGSLSTVIWNPWIDKSKAMSDFPDDGYKSMVCVETANAAQDARTVAPGESIDISQSIAPIS